MEDNAKWLNPKLLKTSEYPANIIPPGAIAIKREYCGCTVKGFYDPKTGVLHIQEETFFSTV